MIAKSDLVILAISGTLLATGIYRWQSNLQARAQTTAAIAPSSSILPGNAQPGSDIALTARPSVVQDSVEAPPPAVALSSPDTDNISQTTSQNITRSVELAAPANGDVEISGNDAPLPGSTANVDPLYGRYIVESGDSLSYIADTFGTSIDTLRSINSISGSLIFIGQEILYPLPAN